MNVALTVICAACCIVLVGAEYRRTGGLRIASKLAASAAFVLLGLVSLEALDVQDPAAEAFATWVFLGLVLGAVGDACLLGASNRAFMAGLVAFLGGHIAYVVAAGQLVAPEDWLADAGIYAALPIAAGAIALAHLWPKLGSMRIPVIAYVLTIVSMVVAAIAVARGATLRADWEPIMLPDGSQGFAGPLGGVQPNAASTLFVAGAALFFVSDLAVARDKFVQRAFVNRLWGLPAYYAGQLLIAWSLAGL